MSTFTQTFTRPSTTVNWHETGLGILTRDFSNYALANFKATGKLVSDSTQVSTDGLVLVITKVFATESDKAEFLSDTTRLAYAAARDAYNTENGITYTIS
jgi:hypothetical protein